MSTKSFYFGQKVFVQKGFYRHSYGLIRDIPDLELPSEYMVRIISDEFKELRDVIIDGSFLKDASRSSFEMPDYKLVKVDE